MCTPPRREGLVLVLWIYFACCWRLGPTAVLLDCIDLSQSVWAQALGWKWLRHVCSNGPNATQTVSGATPYDSCRFAARHNSLGLVYHRRYGPVRMRSDSNEHQQTLGTQYNPKTISSKVQ